MNTVKTLQLVSTNLEDTLNLASGIGSKLRGGEVIELVSDLGGGKTAFVRGLAKGMGSQETVGSPTFTISREYKAGALTLYHFDFYRLGEAGIMADELSEIISNPQAVTAVEWADVVEDVLPEDRVTIKIIATAEETRQLTVSYPESREYLFMEGNAHDYSVGSY